MDSLESRYITSFRMDGLHRTGSEKEDEKDVGVRVVGGYADFRFEHWRFGALASFKRFGLPVSKGDQPYKSKSFEGEANSNFGVDYHLIMNQISVFGEAGISQNLKPAYVNGLVWKAHPQWSLSFCTAITILPFNHSIRGHLPKAAEAKMKRVSMLPLNISRCRKSNWVVKPISSIFPG